VHEVVAVVAVDDKTMAANCGVLSVILHRPYVAEEGKLGWGCSHETVFEDLCQAMGLGENLSEEDEDKANQVFDKFFTE
jgi:hypothetical protein